jgi:hypothetical protein
MGQNDGRFTGRFWIVKANLSQTSSIQALGIYSNGATVDVSNFFGPLGLVVEATCCFARVELAFRGVITREASSPYAL